MHEFGILGCSLITAQMPIGAQEGKEGTIASAQASFSRRHRDNTGMVGALAWFFFHEARFEGPA